MGRPTAYKTPTTMQPLNLPNVKGGEIMPYRPVAPVIPPPTRLYPEPYRPDRPAPSFKIPAISRPGDAEKELERALRPRSPVVDSDGRSSSQSRNPQSYPNNPDPSAGWKSFADFNAWRNGTNRSTIDEEREAYEFTKEWGKSGGVLYPFTDAGPRIPIVSGNFEKANRYRVRNGLPAIDRFGYEQSQPINPSSPPRGDFASNPFKLPRPDPGPDFGTPSNFDESPYNFDIDPDTGRPYTDVQRRRGDELGRPPWHINPETGNPWGKEEPGSPIPLPFDGYPGGGLRYPTPEIPPVQTDFGTWTFDYAFNFPDFPSGRKSFQSSSGAAPYFAFAAGQWNVSISGKVVYPNFIGQGPPDRQYVPIMTGLNFVLDPVSPGIPSAPGEFTRFGNPAPLLNPVNQPQPQPRPLPLPIQDPRVNPTIPRPLPFAPTKRPFDAPNTTPVNPSPIPDPLTLPKPQIPGQPNYAPSPRPYPRTDPSGRPQPNFNPSNQPEPARPSTPKPEAQKDRPPYPPKTDTKNPPCPSPCPDPCIPEKVIQITYRKFTGCNKTVTGAPDRFQNQTMNVPEKMALAITASLNSIADIEAQKCDPCCYWDIVPGIQATIYTGVPQFIGQEIALPKGCVNVRIAYDVASAKSDNTLRNLRRVAAGNTNANSFINTARVWMIDSKGNAFSQDEIWVPNTVLSIPFSYRDEVCRVRIMPKSLGIQFTVSDMGDRWVQKKD